MASPPPIPRGRGIDVTGADELRLDLGFAVDLPVMFRLFRMGPLDPTCRRRGAVFWKATRTPEGPATLAVAPAGNDRPPVRVRAKAYGPGAAWILEAVPGLVGAHDDPGAFRPSHPGVARLGRRHPALRIGTGPSLVEALVPIVLQQRVTWGEAVESFRRLVHRHGEPAPGPHPWLRLPPTPARLARLSGAEFHAAGVEASRSEPIRRLCTIAPHVEALRTRPLAEAKGRLLSIPGVGAWTVGMAAGQCLGDPDAVPVGDVHLPSVVAYNLAGEARADDARMLELLDPFRGHRWRVIRLLSLAGRPPPRRGPKRGPSRWAADL